jgi:hypothetical protein
MSRTSLPRPQPQLVWEKARCRASPSPDYYHRGNSTEYELQGPSYPPRAHRDPVTQYTSSNTNMPIYSRTPSPYLRYLPIRPHKQYSAKALAPNRHWFLQAHQDLHPRQRALDMSFVIPASKRSAAITHCLSVWTARNRHQHPKNLQSLVEAPLRKETCDTRSCSRYGVRASMVGRTSVISLSFCNPRSGELNKHGHEQSRTICRIIAPGVNRNCQEIGINVANATTLRFASRVTSAHPHFFRTLISFLMWQCWTQRGAQCPSDPSFPGKAPLPIEQSLGKIEWRWR